MKRALATFVLLFSMHGLQAQSTRDSVILTIKTFFEGMTKADTVLLSKTLSSTAVLQTISERPGSTVVLDEKISAFLASIAKLAPGAADEQIEIGTVLIDAGLASVWTPYKFFYQGKFSHCGVNSFQLVRLKNEWKIQYIIDTRRKEVCL